MKRLDQWIVGFDLFKEIHKRISQNMLSKHIIETYVNSIRSEPPGLDKQMK